MRPLPVHLSQLNEEGRPCCSYDRLEALVQQPGGRRRVYSFQAFVCDQKPTEWLNQPLMVFCCDRFITELSRPTDLIPKNNYVLCFSLGRRNIISNSCCPGGPYEQQNDGSAEDFISNELFLVHFKGFLGHSKLIKI